MNVVMVGFDSGTPSPLDAIATPAGEESALNVATTRANYFATVSCPAHAEELCAMQKRVSDEAFGLA